MNLINKIRNFVKDVSSTERNKKTDFSDGKFLVSSSIEQIIKDHEPEPPKVRPMSELPKGNIQVVFIITNTKEDSWTYGIGTPLNLEAIIINNKSYFKDKNYCAKWSSMKLKGWLYELPNKIKL